MSMVVINNYNKMTYKQIGNRTYELQTRDDDQQYIVKFTHNDDNDTYNHCGEWTLDEFLAHDTVFDGNTEAEYDNIKSELNL